MEPSFVLDWNAHQLSTALKISESDVIEYFTDGRRVSFLMERSIRNQLNHTTAPVNGGWALSPSEGAGFDLMDPNNGRWEVRSISKSQYFCPSYMVGSGRIFELNGFLEKLSNVSGYFLTDIKEFPRSRVWQISVDVVRNWWNQGNLGKNTTISRKKKFQ